MAHCPECGKKGEHDFCAYCGRELVPDPEERPYISPSVTMYEAKQHRESLARPPDYSGPTYDAEPEPKVGEWKLGLGIVLLVLVLFGAFLSLIGLSFITWYLADKARWNAWAKRVHHNQH